MVHTGLGLVLDELRQNLAAVHGGIFPHSVLSSQHISLLASQKPLTMDEVLLFLYFRMLADDYFYICCTISYSLIIASILQLEEVLGKRIAERYGNEILAAITDYVVEHPDDDATDNAGAWVAPKAKKSAESPATGTTKAPPSKRVTEGSTSTKAPSTRPGKRVSERTTTRSSSIKDFLVKPDAESGPNDQAVAEGSRSGTTKTPTKRLSLRRPPVSSSPLPATQKEESTKISSQRRECIDLDSDSDQDEDQPRADGKELKSENWSEDIIEETTSEEEDEFSLFKRPRRR